MDKKRKILTILLIIFVVLFILVIVFVKKFSYPKYGDDKLFLLSSYLKSETYLYNGLHNNIDLYDSVDVDSIDDIEFDKLVASSLISSSKNSNEFNYDKCNECYDLFSKYDNIKFYEPKYVDEISQMLFGKNIKKITQYDYDSYNVLYYNSKIDMYYINAKYYNEINYIFELKEYNQKGQYLYFDYYSAEIVKNVYDNDFSNEVFDSENMESEPAIDSYDSISLYSLSGNVLLENINYNDLFNQGELIGYEKYTDYYDVIRYEFKFDKKIKHYVLNKVLLLQE